MSKTKFTPAPWGWQKFGTEWCLVGQHGMRPIVLDVGRVGKARGEMLRVRMTEPPGIMVPFDPSHPDAQLLRGAPTLYEALERFAKAWDAGWRDGEGAGFIPTHEQMNELHDAFDAAHAAMALARGESPSPDATPEVES